MSYRVWCEVFDADGVRLAVVENVSSVSVTRILDGVGSVRVTLPGTDEKALTYLTYEARVRVYVHQNNQTREVGRGIMRKPVTTDTAGGSTFVVDCPDELTELKDISVLLGRSYGAAAPVSLSSVVESLVGLVDGWTASVDPLISNNLVSMKLDGVSVLKGLQTLAENYGLHLRQSVGSKTLEFGAFGTDEGMIIRNTTHGNIRLQDNDDLALIENLQITGTSENVVNRIYPVGAGQGLAAINLENSTRTAPYTIQSVTGPDGRTLRYIETGARPVREEVRRYKITPIANSAAAKEVADDALYDAAAVDLARSSVVQESYRVVLAKVRRNIRAGDVIRLVFKGIVQLKSGAFVYRDVDDTFTVLEVNEDFGESGVKTSLVISNVDREMMSVEKAIVQSINDVKVSQFEVVTFPFFDSYALYDIIGGAYNLSDYDNFPYYKPARFRVVANSLITKVTAAFIRFKTFPISSPSAWSAGLGANVFVASQSGIYPKDVYLYIDGVNVTATYGGPWNPSPANNQVDVTIDVSDYFEGANLYTTKNFEFRCIQGNYVQPVTVPLFYPLTTDNVFGNIEFTVTLLGITQAIQTT